jgi:bifunctional non-homologous end joining protein LigD
VKQTDRTRTTPSSKAAAKAPRRPVAAAAVLDPTIAGVRITHPKRIVYPAVGITKLMVAEYYERVAPRLLPYVAGRPLSIVRCPDGASAACFFQKHVGEHPIPGIDVAMIEDSSGRNPGWRRCTRSSCTSGARRSRPSSGPTP